MNVTYSPRIERGGQGHRLLEQATQLLEEVLGQSAGLVAAEWDQLVDERGRKYYILNLSDPGAGTRTVKFAPGELSSPTHLRYRLYRLWGDLLQDRSHKQLKELTRAGDQAGE
jgi:hypothetical protein